LSLLVYHRGFFRFRTNFELPFTARTLIFHAVKFKKDSQPSETRDDNLIVKNPHRQRSQSP